MAFIFPLLVVLLALIPSRRPFATGAAMCYKRDGSPAKADLTNWAPCYPERKESHCCSTNDFCMSNGLCLDAGDDQYFTTQGCTNPSWDGCSEICNNTARGSGGEGIVSPCSWHDSGGTITYCCGKACDCSRSDLPKIRIASDVFRPPQAASTSSSQPPTQTATHDNNSSNNTNNSNNNNDTHVLAIGLGVGIPLALALIGGIVFLGLQLRKWTAAATQQRAMNEKAEGGGKTASVNVSGGGGGDGGVYYIRQELEAGHGA